MSQILWFGPASAQMSTHLPPVRLEVLADEGDTLKVKVLDQPLSEQGDEPMLRLGEELRIANKHRSAGKEYSLMELLRTRYVVPWYRSEVDDRSIAGCVYSREPTVRTQ